MTDLRPYFLVAEDDPDDQFMIQQVIFSTCPAGIDIRFVNNGIELVDFLGRLNGQFNPPGLLILDLNMPRKDGRQALSEIKANAKFASIPVAVLTTSQDDGDRHYCRKLGIVGYYQKPSSIAELREIIARLYMDFFHQG